jgi:GNAT superfamily N-acetyltransferase
MAGGSGTSIGSIEARRHGLPANSTEAAPTILTVAPAGVADAATLVDVLAGAFLDDPTWSWAFPDQAARIKWWQHCIEGALRYPWIHEPHYYLSLLGTRDEHRGRGLGMALLKENLARIDAERMPA